VGGGHLSEALSVRARFERLPASIKGAFILRGEDADPHQVEFRAGRIVGVGSNVQRPMPMPAASLDAVPHRDVFVPFEAPIAELDPGWYSLEADLEVDGVAGVFDGGRRFSIPWPRATVRRGQVRLDRDVKGKRGAVRLEQLELGGDSAKLHLRADAEVEIRLSADGDRLERLDVERDESTGRTRVTTYPVMRTHRVVRIEIAGVADPLEVPLPE
jgi:hypothetical protein